MKTNAFLKGKYTGKTFVEVGKTDYDYLCWCLSLNIDLEVKEAIYTAMEEIDIEDDLPF